MSKTTAADSLYLLMNKRIHRDTCKRRGTWKSGAMGTMTYGAAAAMVAEGTATPAACCKPKIDPADASPAALAAEPAAKPRRKTVRDRAREADAARLAEQKAAGQKAVLESVVSVLEGGSVEAAVAHVAEVAPEVAEQPAEKPAPRRGVRATSAAGKAYAEGEPERVDKDVRVRVDGQPVTVHYLERVRVPGQKRVVKATWQTEAGVTIVLEGTVYAVAGEPTDARTLTDAVKVAIG